MGDTATTVTPVRRIGSAEEAAALAERLLTPGRDRPTVVLTIAGGHGEPFGDPEKIQDAVGDLAEVVVMPTSDVSWAFSRRMTPGTQVYGGAGRVYPLDHTWVSFPARSALRFAYSTADRDRITDQLISDALQAALTDDVLASHSSPAQRPRRGVVAGVIGSRAIVRLDDGTQATVWEELTAPGVRLDRVLAAKQKVSGVYDPVSRRLDLRGELRPDDTARATAAVRETYRPGDVVLADVVAVGADTVELRLLPGLGVRVDRSAVTSNTGDSLADLFTLGEVVACRVSSIDPVELRLDDIDDDEVAKPAPSLLPGGPSWLTLPEPAAAAKPAACEASSPSPGLAPARSPSPLDLFPKSPEPAPDVERRTAELLAERARFEALAAELTALRDHAAELEHNLALTTHLAERRQSQYRHAELARQKASRDLKKARQQHGDPAGPAFADPVEQFRHDVYCEWVRRIPAAEKTDRKLAEFDLGPQFLSSVEQLEGVSRDKIVAVVVEVLTGIAERAPGRDLHQLRAGEAGSPYQTRPGGGTSWRVSLQSNSPAARRMHFWRVRDRYEFSRVCAHDEFRP